MLYLRWCLMWFCAHTRGKIGLVDDISFLFPVQLLDNLPAVRHQWVQSFLNCSFAMLLKKNGQNFDFRGSPLWYSINTTDLVHVENDVVGGVRPVLISQVLQHRLLARIHLVLLLGAILEENIKENFWISLASTQKLTVLNFILTFRKFFNKRRIVT